MISQVDSRADASLRRLWHQWVAVVEFFALHSRGRRWLSPQKYDILYRELVAACRKQAATAGEEERAFYNGLENLILPWLNLRAFEKAECDILFNLLERCRQTERRPGWQRRFTGARWSAVAVFAGAGAALLLAAFWALKWLSKHKWGTDWLASVWKSIKDFTLEEKSYAVAGGVVLVAVAIFLVVRVGRRW